MKPRVNNVRLQTIFSPAFLLMIAACAPDEGQEMTPEPSARAREIAATSIIVDGHVDVPYRLENNWADISEATVDGNFDYPRAVAGGLNAPFMSIYTPSDLEAAGRSKDVAERLIDIVEGFATNAPDKFAVAYSVDDVRRHFTEGLISLPLGMENGSPLEGDLANVQHFYDRGIRYITLAHNGSNHICDSSRDEPMWDGLSEFGVGVVREMNRLGIMVDVSHISDEAFWDVLEVTQVPVIASHSSTRHFTPGWPRNMSDEMIVAMAERGGIVMVNFGSSFLSAEANVYRYGRRDAYRTHLAENGLAANDQEEQAFNEVWAEEHGPFPFADVDLVLDHFDYLKNLVGVDHVGIGTDYDGVGDTLPIGLKDVSTYPVLIQGFLDRGYSEDEIKKILGENLLRVWGEVEEFAGRA
jgi:membrane dipeptidase